MSDKTDETARAILDAETLFDISDRLEASNPFEGVDELQKLAKFWLMKEQIADLLESANEGELRSMDYDRAEWLLDKIKELDG